MPRQITLKTLCEAVAKNLREFGYPDASAQMVKDTYEAIKAGKKDEELPHGIVGRFAKSQITEHRDLFDKAAS